MLLRDYLDRYNQTHDIQPSTLAHYRWVIRSFDRAQLGQPPLPPL